MPLWQYMPIWFDLHFVVWLSYKRVFVFIFIWPKGLIHIAFLSLWIFLMIRVYFYNLINPQWHFNMVGMLFLFKKNVFENFINVPPLWSGDTSLYDRDAVLSIICVRLPIYGQGVNHYIWSGCFLYFMKGTDTEHSLPYSDVTIYIFAILYLSSMPYV